MPYDGSGNFTRDYNWQDDKLNAIKIQAVRMDGEFDNFAAGMNQVLLRNGVVAMAGDFKLGGNKITGVGAGSAGSPSVQYSADATTGLYFPAAGVVALAAVGVERFRAHGTGASVTGFLGANTNTPRSALDVAGTASFRGAFEEVVVTATALTGVVNLDYNTAAVYLCAFNAAGNWSFNIRGSGAATLDSVMAVGQMLTLAVEVPQGATAYYCTAITVDGNVPAQTRWQGGAPVAGNVSGVDVYLIRVIKVGANSFYVRGSMAQEL